MGYTRTVEEDLDAANEKIVELSTLLTEVRERAEFLRGKAEALTETVAVLAKVSIEWPCKEEAP